MFYVLSYISIYYVHHDAPTYLEGKDVDGVLCELRRVLRPKGLVFLNLPAFSFLHSAHDDAVLPARRFRNGEVRSLLAENGFAVRRLTYWTTLLFPLAVIARTLGESSTDAISVRNRRGAARSIAFCMRSRRWSSAF
jgi:hypothetical protein